MSWYVVSSLKISEKQPNEKEDSDLQDDQGVLHGEVVRRQPLALPDELLTLRAQKGAQFKLCRITTRAQEQTLASHL